MNNRNEIQDLLKMADRWRRGQEKQLTGENDGFLVKELEEQYEEWMLPHLKGITKDDNEYNWWGSEIWNNVTILQLEVKVAALEQAIRSNGGRRWKPKLAKFIVTMASRVSFLET